MRVFMVHFSFYSKVLWPYLLETIVPEIYQEAMGPVCKSIAHIAGLKRERDDDDYIIDFDREGTNSDIYGRFHVL